MKFGNNWNRLNFHCGECQKLAARITKSSDLDQSRFDMGLHGLFMQFYLRQII